MKKSILILFVVLSSTISFAQTVTKRTTAFNLENKVALQGYDPVAYFTQKKAVKGKSALATPAESVFSPPKRYRQNSLLI